MRLRTQTTSNYFTSPSRLSFWVGLGGIVVGIATGVLAGSQPLYLVVALVATIVFIYFFADFERAVIALLILRSSLDLFTAQQLPAVFAIGLDALTLLYVSVLLLNRRTVHTDWFWWFFAIWVLLQGMWPIFCILGELGLDASTLPDNIREWIRLFSWLMLYLLVMQLKDRIHPEKIISLLFISLIVPVIIGLMQIYLPSLLPAALTSVGDLNSSGSVPFEITGTENRIKGTFAHPNNFVLYLLLFTGLTWWKLLWAKRRWPWLLLLAVLANLYVATGAIFGLAMLGIFIVSSIVPKLKLSNMIAGLLLLLVIFGLFMSTDFGRDRLTMLADTPLLNPHIDISRAILLSRSDYNSFNWRIAHWHDLLKISQQAPLLGHGLNTAIHLARWHPHNDYIRSLVEGGMLGLVTFLSFLLAQAVRIVQLVRRAPRGSNQQDLCFILLAIFLSTTVGMFTDNVWSGTAFYFYWWTIFAVAGWKWQKRLPANSPFLTTY